MMACGRGEAHISLEKWCQHRSQQHTVRLVQLVTHMNSLPDVLDLGFSQCLGFRDVIFIQSSITTKLHSNRMNCAEILGLVRTKHTTSAVI